MGCVSVLYLIAHPQSQQLQISLMQIEQTEHLCPHDCVKKKNKKKRKNSSTPHLTREPFKKNMKGEKRKFKLRSILARARHKSEKLTLKLKHKPKEKKQNTEKK
ncbi:hypothetical protein, unlikely [Trypanosoma brucei gambiense DAL972]|uniref:Uncharacterized protein n=1 Tax=Trypanosoma brucei gambiense (strain MHOM/CI/86/DAL972) TaxID=679716 RepID=D0A441_TRYB9|nr:hypothetical protein, unlikely [Trypanosoma brucei gambiense DAL972]CBH16035.1 hypothetical protein, unlikely [Trypanosoma brucei gambiense DAL972]|eukprot:XP_011778299.1 hypothetical protein, unlikely [Trypanosoma brucei gambiense DAL972]